MHIETGPMGRQRAPHLHLTRPTPQETTLIHVETPVSVTDPDRVATWLCVN